MMSELFGLFGLGQRSWTDAAMVLSLFWVAIARPDRIRSFGQFRAACLLFMISLIAPGFISLFIMTSGGGGFNRGMGGQNMGLGMYLQVLPGALLAISFWLAIDAITPRRSASDGRSPAVPPPAGS